MRVRVADWSADFDHNRMVITLLGSPEEVEKGAFSVAQTAVDRIDLKLHTGVHPRIGAVDVIPFTPIRGVSMQVCVDLSKRVAVKLAEQLGVTVYLYALSARSGRPTELPDIRKKSELGLTADYGPPSPQLSTGSVVVGARNPLVAWNLWLDKNDSNAAKSIARQIRIERETNSTLYGVRAIGLSLPSVDRAQISLNVTNPDKTPLNSIFDSICHIADNHNVQVVESEFIGLVPLHSFGGATPEALLWKDYKETQTLEHWLSTI